MSRTVEVMFKCHCIAEIGDGSIEEEKEDLKAFIAEDLHAVGYLDVYTEDIEILECK